MQLKVTQVDKFMGLPFDPPKLSRREGDSAIIEEFDDYFLIKGETTDGNPYSYKAFEKDGAIPAIGDTVTI